MTDGDFVALLEQAYRTPAADFDEAALARAVRKGLEAADRRRRIVLAGATALGTTVASLGPLALGLTHPLDSLAREASAALAAISDGLASLPSAWTFALVGLVLAASAATRGLEDS